MSYSQSWFNDKILCNQNFAHALEQSVANNFKRRLFYIDFKKQLFHNSRFLETYPIIQHNSKCGFERKKININTSLTEIICKTIFFSENILNKNYFTRRKQAQKHIFPSFFKKRTLKLLRTPRKTKKKSNNIKFLIINSEHVGWRWEK